VATKEKVKKRTNCKGATMIEAKLSQRSDNGRAVMMTKPQWWRSRDVSSLYRSEGKKIYVMENFTRIV